MSDKGSEKTTIQIDAISGADRLGVTDGSFYVANFEAPSRSDVTGAGGDANLGHQGPTIPEPPRSDVTGAIRESARADAAVPHDGSSGSGELAKGRTETMPLPGV